MVQEATALADQALLWRQNRTLFCLVGILHPDADTGSDLWTVRFHLRSWDNIPGVELSEVITNHYSVEIPG